MTEFYGVRHGDWFWHELTTPDAKAGAAFYKAVLGWEVESQEMPGFTYHLFKRGGQNLGGIMEMSGPEWEGIAPHWMVYMAVDDAEAAKAKVEAAGGQVKFGPFEVPGVGRMLVCTDPQGAVFTLTEPAPEMRAAAGG